MIYLHKWCKTECSKRTILSKPWILHFGELWRHISIKNFFFPDKFHLKSFWMIFPLTKKKLPRFLNIQLRFLSRKNHTYITLYLFLLPTTFPRMMSSIPKNIIENCISFQWIVFESTAFTLKANWPQQAALSMITAITTLPLHASVTKVHCDVSYVRFPEKKVD